MITIRNRAHAARILRHLREQQHLTRRQLAARIYVAPKTIQSRENGITGLAADVFIDTAHALGYTVALIRNGHHDTGTGWPDDRRTA